MIKTYEYLDKINFPSDLKKISESTGANWKDLGNPFDDEEKTIFTDSVHLTDLGQTLLAEVIFKEIKNKLFSMK